MKKGQKMNAAPLKERSRGALVDAVKIVRLVMLVDNGSPRRMGVLSDTRVQDVGQTCLIKHSRCFTSIA